MTRRARPAFTLVEILAVIGVMCAVGGLISATLIRQQRVLRATSETIDVRRSVRDAIAILAEEIRSASPRDTVRLMSDSAIELFTGLGVSVACASLTGSDVGLAPVSTAGVSLTSWLTVPDSGDLALIYHSASSTPGAWERHRILALSAKATSSTCPASTGLSGSPGESASSYVVTLDSLAAPVPAGAPVRFIRRGRYSLYRSSDRKWYLGYRRCNAIGPSICGVIQPVSGYYQPFSADSARTGILFRFFDSSGQRLGAASDPLLLSRVEIVARASSPLSGTIGGDGRALADSTRLSATLRNIP